MLYKKRFLLRCVFFIAGMLIAALGIALVTNASLGTTPITSLPLAVDAIWPLSIGTYTVMLNACFVILQKVILGPEFRYTTLLQMPPILIFGAGIDMWLHYTAFIVSLPYLERCACMLLGVATLACGVLIQVMTNVTVLPGEGIVLAISHRFHYSFSSMKVVSDCSMVAAAAIVGLLGVGHIVGIREGTLCSAVLTGIFIRFYSFVLRKLGFVEKE